MKLMRITIALAAVFLAAFQVRASSALSLYNHGNELYKQGDFDGARKSYEQALEAGMINAELYFNLGNADLRTRSLGPAVANYLRAKRLAPRDSDIQFNLDYARSKIASRPESLPRGPFTRAFQLVTNQLSANELTIVFLVCFWGVCLAWAALILVRRESRKKTLRVVIYVMASALVVVLPFAIARIKGDYFTPRAVITAEKVTARSGPDESNAALFDLYEGIDVVVGQCDRGWCRVSTPGGFIGYVPAESFERL